MEPHVRAAELLAMLHGEVSRVAHMTAAYNAEFIEAGEDASLISESVGYVGEDISMCNRSIDRILEELRRDHADRISEDLIRREIEEARTPWEHPALTEPLHREARLRLIRFYETVADPVLSDLPEEIREETRAWHTKVYANLERLKALEKPPAVDTPPLWPRTEWRRRIKA